MVHMYAHMQTGCTHTPHRANRERASIFGSCVYVCACMWLNPAKTACKRVLACWLSAAFQAPRYPVYRGLQQILTICSSMKASPSSRPSEDLALAASAAGGGLDEAADDPPAARSSARLLLLSSRSKSLKEKSPLPLLLLSAADDGLEKEHVCCRGAAVADDRKKNAAAAGGGVNACNEGSSNICRTEQQQQERMKRARMIVVEPAAARTMLVCRQACRVPSKQRIPISLFSGNRVWSTVWMVRQNV